MTWHSFLVVWVSGAALLALSRQFSGRRLRLLRVCVATLALSFFIDYPAEDRSIWTFMDESRVYVIEVPFENMLFMAASLPYTLAIYLSIQSRHQRRNGQ